MPSVLDTKSIHSQHLTFDKTKINKILTFQILKSRIPTKAELPKTQKSTP